MSYVFMYNSNYSMRYDVKNSNDKILNIIGDILHEGAGFCSSLINELLDKNSKGLTAELVDTTFEGDLVIVEPVYEEQEYYRVVINRQKLIDILKEWEKVIETRPPYVLITEDENGQIAMQPLQEDISKQLEQKQ